jgi:hypothetical protein
LFHIQDHEIRDINKRHEIGRTKVEIVNAEKGNGCGAETRNKRSYSRNMDKLGAFFDPNIYVMVWVYLRGIKCAEFGPRKRG